jgi:hypothetical protein
MLMGLSLVRTAVPKPRASSPVDNAFNFNTVLSLPFVLAQLPPLLSAAVDGDPATTPEV